MATREIKSLIWGGNPQNVEIHLSSVSEASKELEVSTSRNGANQREEKLETVYCRG